VASSTVAEPVTTALPRVPWLGRRLETTDMVWPDAQRTLACNMYTVTTRLPPTFLPCPRPPQVRFLQNTAGCSTSHACRLPCICCSCGGKSGPPSGICCRGSSGLPACSLNTLPARLPSSTLCTSAGSYLLKCGLLTGQTGPDLGPADTLGFVVQAVPTPVLRINGISPSPVPFDFNDTLSVNLRGALCSADGTGAVATCPGTSSLEATGPTAYCKVRSMLQRHATCTCCPTVFRSACFCMTVGECDHTSIFT
jgi:hypothetical protein